MNSRDRVEAAINHHEPDRIPIDLGGTAASGINVNAYVQLKEWLGLRTDGIQIFDIFGMMARIEPDVIEHFETDTLLVPSLCPRFGIPIRDWKPWQLLDGTPVQVPIGFETTADHDGSLLLMVQGRPVGRMPKTETYFLELAETDAGGLEALAHPPDPDGVRFPVLSEEDVSFRQEIAKRFYETTDKALVVDLVDNLRWNTSIANWLYAMAADPRRTYELHEKKSLAILESVKRLAQAVGPYVSVFAIYQDYGTQRGPLISPASFEDLVVPHYKRVFDWIHENTDWKVLFHSCGSIVPLIPLIIDMGADILNPVQCNTEGMEPQKLKEEFGNRIVFWGGGADTQTVLPLGTPEEVQCQVQERMAAFGPGGGYVFAPSQDIQADVPPQNLAAMYEAVRKWGRYPLPTMVEYSGPTTG
jgi:hypothetical protein